MLVVAMSHTSTIANMVKTTITTRWTSVEKVTMAAEKSVELLASEDNGYGVTLGEKAECKIEDGVDEYDRRRL